MEKGWYALIVFGVGFLLAQVWKLVEGLVRGGGKEVVDFKTAIGYFTRSGGMPSGHTASFTGASVYLGCAFGFGSAVFALAACTWMIVVYDATHVRYAVGEQGKALNGLLKAAGKTELPIVEGHTMAQVVVGAILGVIVGISMAFWTIW